MVHDRGRPARRPWVVAAGALMLALVAAAACGQKSGVGIGGASGDGALSAAGASRAATGDGSAGAGAAGLTTADTATPGQTAGGTADPSDGAPSTPSGASSRTGAPGSAKVVSGPGARSGGASSSSAAGSGRTAQQATPPDGGVRAATTAGPAGGTSGPAAGSDPSPGAAAGGAAGAVDRTGVSDTVIKIGVHAPLTGAAPLPQNAFDKGKDVYWKFLAAKGGLLGRNVQIIFKDDQFNPAHAVQVCRELVEQDKVFLVFGVAGSDQITACARYANAAGVPYLSAGVNEDGLTGLANYFAVSQTYAQQNRTIAALIKNRMHKTKIAIVLNATPALNETQRSITAEAQAIGLTIVRQSRISKQASDSELVSEAQQLRASGAEAVYVLTAPVNFIKLATNAYAQAYSPLWTGPGLTNGLNIVTEAGCPAVDGARWLSPFPQLDVIDRLDPDYTPAYKKYAGGEPDDIGLAEWGLNKTLHLMMDAAGHDLSRQSFVRALTSGRRFSSNVFPSVAYDGSIRFGANSMHVLRADCSSRTWKTETAFAEGF
ncbi:MAG: branched-chain amino acid transport system substrate-binding protein [Actinomycetota bacterium]|nr:branched-chain amino acid transport system substrate-binding protein [Actinomycetota bacterium]